MSRYPLQHLHVAYIMYVMNAVKAVFGGNESVKCLRQTEVQDGPGYV